jgi:hypothetical protein
VVGKHRVNALYGTALDLILRANALDTLIILGYATSGVVLSTVRAAADLDYRLVVVEDCCADQDPDLHDFLTQRLFPRQADVGIVASLARVVPGLALAWVRVSHSLHALQQIHQGLVKDRHPDQLQTRELQPVYRERCLHALIGIILDLHNYLGSARLVSP